MRQQLVTDAIVLARTDYQEADRILTLLTPEQGKVRVIAKGVRKQKSKLAGGIELLSVSRVSYIPGRGEIGTLVSTQLQKHYSTIVKHIDRTMLAYELVKQINKTTEDKLEPVYFEIMHIAFASLDDVAIGAELVRVWFLAQLLSAAGHQPNLHTTLQGDALQAGKMYDFSYDDMCFSEHPSGGYGADHIKFLRLCFSGNQPRLLQKVANIESLVHDVCPLIKTMAASYLRV